MRSDARWRADRSHLRRMRRLGIELIGACCGSTPAHIAAMRAALEQAQDAPETGGAIVEGSGDRVESAESRAARSAERRQARRQRLGG